MIAESVGGYYDYIRYKADMNGISGSDRKEKIFQYILDLDLENGEKALLFKSVYPKDHSLDKAVLKYLDSRDNLTDRQRRDLLLELGFELDARGNVIG